MSEHANLIDQLGGGTAVAHALWGSIGHKGRAREAIYKWKQNGVPWKWRRAVERLARERGIDLPPEFLEPASGSEG